MFGNQTEEMLVVAPEAWRDMLELMSYLVTLLGVPVAIFVYWRQKQWERREREVEAHSAAHQRYVDYLVLCLEHPDAKGFEYVNGESEVEELRLPIKQITLFTILISTMETAYLAYQHQPSSVRRSQWLGWLQYIEWWFRRDDFRRAWNGLSDQFHEDFVQLGNRIRDGADPERLLAPARRFRPREGSL